MKISQKVFGFQSKKIICILFIGLLLILNFCPVIGQVTQTIKGNDSLSKNLR